VKFSTTSPTETQAIAAAVASVVRAGDVILLSGDLGAGKTTFTQGFARALGVTDPVTSPTFTLLNEYRGRLRVLHADVYRLESLQEVIDLGIGELVEEESVALVEWGEAAAPALPGHLTITIEHGAGDDDRAISLSPSGTAWAERIDALEAALAKWASK
jgi:tRNA threonylcarbamoyladenosine biosynthesis protein TsaE